MANRLKCKTLRNDIANKCKRNLNDTNSMEFKTLYEIVGRYLYAHPKLCIGSNYFLSTFKILTYCHTSFLIRTGNYSH